MKKTSILLITLIVAVCTVKAGDITTEQALKIASQFAVNSSQNIAKARGAKAPVLQMEPKLAYSIKSKDTPVKDNVYVVNLGNDQGFVIVSGESGAEANVLGYCDHGSFSYDDAPIQLKDLLGYYTEAIDSLRRSPAGPARTRAAQEWPSNLGSIIVEPLLTTTWDQGAPYNYHCPEGAVTGCYPTALAQVMNYWKWPKESMGKVGDKDFSGHVYDWDNMLDYYGWNIDITNYISYNDAQAEAVAKLMADIGTAFGTKYLEPNGSPTYFEYDPLVKNFGYEPDIVRNTGKSAVDLINIMESELRKNRPILYCGYPVGMFPMGTSDPHALVCDGYTSNHYFHYNFGWSGAYDGFYKNSFNLYPYNVEIFTNVRPYDAVHKVIGDIDYALLKNGEAHIYEYLKKNVKDEVLEIPATVTGDDGKEYRVTRIRERAFYQKGHFAQLTIGENIEAVDAFSFFYTNIDKLVLSDKMEVVPDQAFLNTKVKSLVIGKNIKRIGKRAFFMCDLSEVTSKSPAFDVDDEAFMATRPDCGEWLGCITSLGKSAFAAASFSDEDKQPRFTHLESIGDLAFNGTFFEKGGFYFPATLRYISPTAFKDARGRWGAIANFEMDENNPYFAIGGGGIYNKNKTCLILTSGVKSPLGDDIKFSEGVIKFERGSITSRPTSIGIHYYGLRIPATVVEMEGAFTYCETMGDIACPHAIPPVISDSTFNDKAFETSPDITLHVPEGTEDLYRNAPGWRKFPNISGDEGYVPPQNQDLQYNMMVSSTDKNGSQRVSIPLTEVTGVSLSEDGKKIIIRRNGKENLMTTLAALDSISWAPGFVYENAEIFDLNDSTLTANAQKCSVKFDATVIDDDVQLSVRNLVLTPKVLENVVRGLAIDLSLSDGSHDLTGTADITIPFSVGPNEQVCAAYFNETKGDWEPIYFRYDKSLGKVTISTGHLSTYYLFSVDKEFSNLAKLNLLIGYNSLFTFNEATKTLLDIVSSEDPDKEMVRKFKDDMALWQSVGLDGFYNGIVSVTEPFLNFKPEAIDNAVTAMGYIGTFMNILDVVGADIRGDNVAVASGTLNTILNFATGQMASAISTPIMSASMGCVAFIGVALNKFGTKVQERIHDLAYDGYHAYYSKSGKYDKDINSCYRSPKDWYKLFYPKFAEGKMTAQQLNNYIEAEVRKYCNEIWNHYGAWVTCCEKCKIWTPGATVPSLNESLMNRLSNEHFAELMEGELTSVFIGIKNRLKTETDNRSYIALDEMAKIVNKEITVRFKDSSRNKNEKSKYAGWGVRFTDAGYMVSKPEQFKSRISEDGTGSLVITLYSLIQNEIHANITLADPNNVDQKSFDFEIPDGEGKVYVTLDLDKGGVTADTQPLEGLELTYDPDVLTFQSLLSDIDSECYIYLNNALNRRARFQAGIEQFFNRHNFITVDEFGNFKIGDDIIGVFPDNGLVAAGKFTINTNNKFIEKTKQQYIKQVANPDKDMDWAYGLFNGTMQYKIDCEYKIMRASVDSNEFEVSYTGTGVYEMYANVLSQMLRANWEALLRYEGQEITVQDIVIQEEAYDGSVKLEYKTTLKK